MKHRFFKMIIISTVDDDHEIRSMVDSSSLISPTPNNANNADGNILGLQLQEPEQHRVERSDNPDQSNDLNKVGKTKGKIYFVYEK